MIKVKVPYQLLKQANYFGLWKDVEFYYMLKSQTPHGSFKKGSVVSSIQNSFDISCSSTWRRLKRLVDLGWIKKHSLAYHLVSYDKVWQDIGYDIIRDKKENLKFKLHRFQLKDFKLQVAQHDLDFNLKQQANIVRKNLEYAQLRKDDYTALKNCESFHFKDLLDHISEKRIVDIVRSQQHSIILSELNKAYCKQINHCNPDITLSGRGFAKLIGLSSSSSGHRILRSMEQKDMIDIKTRVVCLGMKHPLYKMPSGSQYWLEGGMIMMQFTNKLYVNLAS